jgi:hypothetical protein
VASTHCDHDGSPQTARLRDPADRRVRTPASLLAFNTVQSMNLTLTLFLASQFSRCLVEQVRAGRTGIRPKQRWAGKQSSQRGRLLAAGLVFLAAAFGADFAAVLADGFGLARGVSAGMSPIRLLTGQSLKTGHFLQPTARAIGQSVMRASHQLPSRTARTVGEDSCFASGPLIPPSKCTWACFQPLPNQTAARH